MTETRERVAKGTYLAPSRVTLGQLTDDWLRTRRDVREVSLRGYRGVLDPIVGHIGERTVQSITRRDVEALVEWMSTGGGARGRGWSQRSTVYALGALRQVLAYGVADGVIVANPAEGVKAPRRRKGDRRSVSVWEPADLVAFREVADRDEWAAAWRLTLCGLRRSEVLGLSWSCVDRDFGTVTVEASRVVVGKGRTALDDAKSEASHRTVPVEQMHPGTMAVLRSLSAAQAAHRVAAGSAYDASGLVVVDALGHGVSPDAYSDRFRALCVEAGVPTIRLHEVRHTLALMLHRAGEAPADVAALLGHTVATHLAHYVPRTERGAASAASRFGEVLAAVR
ncbi:tyrosine-type recombinase/integrase [Nocardioides sp. MH1]|uniref:tyrosine-type recombinase/integrase n=1 Tax=Nocardioides sp. MH1 TaxID=3242490 RepID=UPI003521A3F0